MLLACLVPFAGSLVAMAYIVVSWHVEPMTWATAWDHFTALQRDAMMVGQGHYYELWDSGLWSAKLGQALAGAGGPPPGVEDFTL